MFLDPKDTVKALGLREGDIVADLGAGSGAYSFAAARIVGATGRVYAIDIQKELLAMLKKRAHAERLVNIDVLAGDIEAPNGTKLKDGSIDAAMIANVLFQTQNKQALLSEVSRILKSKGQALFVDWSGSFGGIGPKEDHLVLEDEATKLFEAAGFSSRRKVAAGDYHYGLIFQKV